MIDLKFTETEKRYFKILTLEGRLDTNTYKALEDYFDKSLQDKQKWFLINLEKVDFISSTGLRVLLKALKEAKAIKGNVVLCALQENIKAIFKMSGFSNFFEIYKTQEEAEQYFI